MLYLCQFVYAIQLNVRRFLITNGSSFTLPFPYQEIKSLPMIRVKDLQLLNQKLEASKVYTYKQSLSRLIEPFSHFPCSRLFSHSILIFIWHFHVFCKAFPKFVNLWNRQWLESQSKTIHLLTRNCTKTNFSFQFVRPSLSQSEQSSAPVRLLR